MANILIIKLDGFGGFVLSLGAMEAIRKKHKSDQITLLTTRPFLDIAEKSRYFDQIIIDSKPTFLQISDWLSLRKALNNGHFDRVYDLQMNKRTGFYYKLFKQKPEWSGRAKGASHPFNDPEHHHHEFQNQKRRLKEFDIDVKIPDLSWMKVDMSFFKLKKPYVLLAVGSDPDHEEKRWPVVKYAALAKKLSNEDYTVGILGTDAESDIARKIIKICPEAEDLTGKTSSFSLASLAMEADFAIGNDTGSMHLISMAGCPVISLFSGVTDPALSAPVGQDVTVLQAELIEELTVGDVMKQVRHYADRDVA